MLRWYSCITSRTTNRLNLPGHSTPQKTITVVQASSKVVIMLPFGVFRLGHHNWDKKSGKYFNIFLANACCWELQRLWESELKQNLEIDGGNKKLNRKNDKGFVNYALWEEGRFVWDKMVRVCRVGESLYNVTIQSANINHFNCQMCEREHEILIWLHFKFSF